MLGCVLDLCIHTASTYWYFELTHIWIQILVQDLTLCMNLNLSGPGFSFLQNGDTNRT